ncbi:two-component system sensor histidine kinase NtrB [Herpetosiphon giganteus]|uniref:two-component system sensor histidine kinase NtrB n=1 Tax=Herpetosiphon giganteus TaxID=2029754 RepID=UPI00195D72FC|nr:ATP-binding protein [Herpetosiphon giganteus]MBM7846179.1 signal transduction histidine kinase [Herpetosiphon giganteus]
MVKVAQQRHWLWFVLSSELIITALHYLTSAHLLPYHSIYRSLYYLPVGVAAVMWGRTFGLGLALFTALVYLPHAHWLDVHASNSLLDNTLEMVTLIVVAALLGSLAEREQQAHSRAEGLRVYIHDVLASLPVGVATIEQQQLKLQNPTAKHLLQPTPSLAQLPQTNGYSEMQLAKGALAVRRSALHNIEGQPIGAVLVFEDIREQQAIAERIRQAERMAALGQLAGGLAHEARNPLGIVRATSQLLGHKLAQQPALAHYTSVINSEVDRLDRLISSLLNYAQPQALQRQPLAINQLLAEFGATCQPLAAEHGVALQLILDSTEPWIEADRDAIWQMLLNLSLNALQASQTGQVIQLESLIVGQQLEILVQDQGVGIDPAIRERIFDPFFTTRDDGTGMGLALVARSVAEHGGTISLEAGPNQGTLARLRLPLLRQGAQA